MNRVGEGRDDVFADGATNGTPHIRINLRANLCDGIRTATVFCPPSASGEIFEFGGKGKTTVSALLIRLNSVLVTLSSGKYFSKWSIE